MNILELIKGHKHYWGIPHAPLGDRVLIQTCYECGADRRVKADLQPSSTPEQTTAVRVSSGSNDDARKAA